MATAHLPAKAMEQHYPTFRRCNRMSLPWTDTQRRMCDEHVALKRMRESSLTSCANIKALQGELFSLGRQGGLCIPKHTHTHTDTDACLHQEDIEIVYLCLVYSTMKAVVLLIKEQAELQCSQVGCKQHKPQQLLPVKGQTHYSVTHALKGSESYL